MKEGERIDGLEILRRIEHQPGGVKAFANGQPVLSDWADVAHVFLWLKVFGCPRLFRGLSRIPPQEHILRLLDVYDAYLQHDGRYHKAEFHPVPYERRAPLSARFRELVEQWVPPGLPAEMMHVARELLHAEGSNPPPGGWDEYAGDPSDPYPPEDCLLWPEGVPALLNAKQEAGRLDAEGQLEGCGALRRRSQE